MKHLVIAWLLLFSLLTNAQVLIRPYESFVLGVGVDQNTQYVFDLGLGGSNPSIQYRNSDGKLGYIDKSEAFVPFDDLAGGSTEVERNIVRNSDFYHWRRGQSFGMPSGTSARTSEGWSCRTTGAGSTVTLQGSTGSRSESRYMMRYRRDGTSTAAQCGQGIVLRDLRHVTGQDSIITVRAQRLQNTTASNRFFIRVYYSATEDLFTIPFGGGGSSLLTTCNFTFTGGMETLECALTGGNQLPVSAKTAWLEVGDDGSGNVGDGWEIDSVTWHRGATSQGWTPKHSSYGEEYLDLSAYYHLIKTPHCVGVSATSVACSVNFPVRMVRSPTAITTSGNFIITDWYATNHTQTSQSINFTGEVTPYGAGYQLNNFTGLTSSRIYQGRDPSNHIEFDAEF